MATVPPYYSALQAKKPEDHRVYHDNDRCFSGRDIPLHERLAGDNGYRRCVECVRLAEIAPVPQTTV